MRLKLYSTLIFIFTIIQIGFSQYGVGNNDGFSSSCYTQPDYNIYGVGNNDGFSSSTYTQPDYNIYGVGSDDGFSSSCYTQPDFNIYGIGNNDGFSSSCHIQPDYNIYGIGNDDGFSFCCYAQPDYNIYGIGNNDGFSFSCYAQPDFNIYGIGNNDGFSFSCYSQPDYNIYGVGNDEGFALACIGGPGTEVPLPIELLWFNAKCDNGDVKLKWQTASEINNDYFIIERSSDAITFEPIGKVKAAGNSNQIVNYEFTDDLSTSHSSLSSVLYYRLKQTDFDGRFEYFNTAVINCQNNSKTVIYPNPNKGLFIIEGAAQNSSVIITDMLGQIIFQSYITAGKTEINLSNQPNGIYLIKVITKGKFHLKKMIIDK